MTTSIKLQPFRTGCRVEEPEDEGRDIHKASIFQRATISVVRDLS